MQSRSTFSAGNLVFDGESFYVYDAWNRVVRVHKPGTLEVSDEQLFGVEGEPFVWYDYDALGRRIRKVINEGTSPHKTTAAGDIFYYDGHRVIEHHKLTTIPTARLVSSGTKRGRVSADTPAHLGTRAGSVKPDDFALKGTVVWPHRSYVYGFNDIDEAMMQIDQTGRPSFLLTDVNLNVTGVLNDRLELIEQYHYTPYGEMYAAETVTNGTPTAIQLPQSPNDYFPVLATSLGHQGLWFDAETGGYYNRTRIYLPKYGRFNQRDPG